MASGEFTLVSQALNYTITHNLNNDGIFIIVQRINSDGTTIVNEGSRYVSTVFVGWTPTINGSDILDTNQGYQQTASGDETKITYSSTVGSYATAARWYFPDANTPSGILLQPAILARTIIGVTNATNNSLIIAPEYPLAAGRWVWKAYALKAV